MLTLPIPADPHPPDFARDISPNDAMYAGDAAAQHYVDVGLSALRLFDHAIAESLLDEAAIRHILDLPCGHGRVARMLRARFPNAELTVSDIDRDGVEFCASRLGARGVYSQSDFDRLELGRRFDLIWVGSLITHLNAANTVKFFRCMQRHLSPHGLLVASNHGTHVAEALGVADPADPIVKDFHETGFGSDADPLALGNGRTLISRHWLEGFFSAEPCGIAVYWERAWDHRHDVVFIKPKPFLPYRFDPQLYLSLNKDVAEAGADPAAHYLAHGHWEGRRYRW